MLRQLREQGVTHIQGGLVVDRSLFNPPRLDVGVPPFDEAPEFQYNVIPDALNLNTSMLGFVLESDDKALSVRTSPVLPGLKLDTSAMAFNDNVCAKWEDTWQLPAVDADAGARLLRFRGQFPRNCRQQIDLNLVDRQWATAVAVRQIWSRLGGLISGPDAEGSTPPDAVVLTSHLGRPFAEVARGMMKRSDNPLTRLTYLRLGVQAAASGEPTLDAAARSVREWFVAKGIPVEGLVMDNGSGLSRSERITARQMAAVLEAAYKGPYAPELLTSLPVAGVDGTLSRRFKGSPVEGRARMKTGTLRNVVALSGYVMDRQDRTWVVAATLNHDSASAKGHAVLDSIIEWVASQR
jgi:D-alanyl-D-alanine carboxypeptidase/D-alanyl-D-alanine-endopeptidase (penicillin-binding protein 4)